ncbi:MAG TPA: glycine--tRNA ligase subunit beta [Thermoanaerobaculia bacterium]
MAEYFFELLTEEIPAWMHDAAQNTLREKLAPFGGKATVTTTPRRIIFFLADLEEREADRVQDFKGPPRKAAYDASGNPTQALNGFLKKNNASVDDLIDGGDYVLVRRNITGRGTDEILRERVPEILESLRWPKMMRWGRGEYSYIRPIHSIVSVYEGKPLPITIFGIASGMTTVGHRTLAPQKIEVHSYNEYVHKLEAGRVIVDVTRRRHVMAERARILANQAGGTPAMDASIWSQWQYLTEYPGLVRAEFRREYLALPEEVLVTVMRVHQKQLPIRDAHNHLTNSFLAVLDNEGDPDGNAAYGNSFVTNARFADAQFFYETDRKRPLESRLEQLEHLQFQEKLGNYRQKSERIVEIARALGADEATLTAARLAKTDLVTEMVKEFTDLQGKIGGIYARDEKYPDEVWQAIYDHYLPVNVEDPLPRTASGALVALADKIDTVAGFFSIGVRPTGSKDPFALRRAAQGVVQILLNRDKRQVRVRISELFDVALRIHNAPQVKGDLEAFFAERVQTILETSAYGFAYDEIQAAMSAGWAGYLPDLVDRIEAVRAVRNDSDFLSILDSAKRIANITEGHSATDVDPAKLENDVEKRLNDLAGVVAQQVDELIAGRHYRDALRSFAAMAPELERFFKDVMVMVDDEAVRTNRMSLLRKIGSSVEKIADVTKIVVARRDYRP